MFKFILILSTFMSIAFAAGESLLDSEATVPGFGKIKYRAPVVDNEKLPIVLFHGVYGGASHRSWRSVVNYLDNAQERVYLMDLPGVGESDKPKKPYSIQDLDNFVEAFLVTVVKQRATVVSESLLSAGVLKISSLRPDLIRRTIILNPSGVFALDKAPSEREQRFYDNFYNNDFGAIAFYQNLLVDNSLRYYLSFGFYDDTLINEDLLADFRAMRENVDQRFITLSFVGGQLYRSFEESSKDIFIPVLAIFGDKYEAFQDNKIARLEDFKAIRPNFEYLEIKDSGSSVQREKPEEVAKEIILFSEND
jgi:pimeloyl-ACP methyl ester carboxylesterase